MIIPFNHSFDQFNQLQGLEHVPLLDCFWFVILLTNCYITSLLLSALSLIIINMLDLLLIMQNDACQHVGSFVKGVSTCNKIFTESLQRTLGINVGRFSYFCENWSVLVFTSKHYENLIGSLICIYIWIGEN